HVEIVEGERLRRVEPVRRVRFTKSQVLGRDHSEMTRQHILEWSPRRRPTRAVQQEAGWAGASLAVPRTLTARLNRLPGRWGRGRCSHIVSPWSQRCRRIVGWDTYLTITGRCAEKRSAPLHWVSGRPSARARSSRLQIRRNSTTL